MTRTFFNCNKNRYISRRPSFSYWKDVYLGLSTCGETFEDSKGVIRIDEWPKKKDKKTDNNLQTSTQ